MGSSRKRDPWWRDPSLIAMATLLIGVSLVTFLQHGLQGLYQGGEATVELISRAGPALALGFLLAGLLTVLFPPATVGRWMGDEAGTKGLLIGVVAGALSPGGPYVMYPIAAALLHGGAGIGSLAAFSATRNMLTVNRILVYEFPFLGGPLTMAKTIATAGLVLVSIVLVPVVFRLMPRSAQDSAREKIGNIVPGPPQ